MILKEEPLISVIVPVYNVSDYLDRSMQTLVAQTYQNLEIIMVDDGATDNSGALCDEWARKDARIRVIHQKNGGLSRARNTGLDAMNGEYVMFFDSDDLLSPDICRVLYDALDNDADIAVCDVVHVFPDKAHVFNMSEQQEMLTPESAIRQMWYQTGFLPSAWAKLYRRELFESQRFTPDLRFEDIDILHEVFWNADKIVYNHSELYGYVHRENSITTAVFSSKEMDILKIANKILRFAQDKSNLICAAEAYATTAALRIYLNAPRVSDYVQGVQKAEELLRKYGKRVMMDRNARTKNRCALCLYFFCKPILRTLYQRVNRWK